MAQLEDKIQAINEEIKKHIVVKYIEFMQGEWDNFDDMNDMFDADIFKETIAPNQIDLAECWEKASNQVDWE